MHIPCLTALLVCVGCVLGQTPVPAPTGHAMIRVIDQHGRAIAGYRVLPLRHFPASELGVGVIPERGEVSVEPRNLQAGGYLLSGLPVATLVVRIDAPGFPRAVSEPFRVTEGTICEVLVQLTDGGVISGRILDGEGRGVADAVVATADWLDSQFVSLEQRNFFRPFLPALTTETETRTDAAGAFTLPRLALGTYALRVHHAEFCDHIVGGVKVTLGKARELPSIVLEPGARITGVASIDGHPQVCLVSLFAKEGERYRVLAEVESDAKGRFTLPRRVRPGEYTIGYRPIEEVGRWHVGHGRYRQFALRVEAGQATVSVVEPNTDKQPAERR